MAVSGIQLPDSCHLPSTHWNFGYEESQPRDGVLQTITNRVQSGSHFSKDEFCEAPRGNRRQHGYYQLHSEGGTQQTSAVSQSVTASEPPWTWREELHLPTDEKAKGVLDSLFSFKTWSEPLEAPATLWTTSRKPITARNGTELLCWEEPHGLCSADSLPKASLSYWQPRLIDVGGCHSIVDSSQEYESDILQCMRTAEGELCAIPSNFMEHQNEINPAMRAMLVNWLVEVAIEFNFETITLHQAVNFLDRFLTRNVVARVNLQLIGVAAILIAAKMEEIDVPGLSRFAYITDNTYTVEQVRKMELIMLLSLSYELSVPTSYGFVLHFSERCQMDQRIVCLALYLCELALLEASMMVDFRPSQIAAGALCLARYNILKPPHNLWTFSLICSSGYSLADIFPCVESLSRIFAQAAVSNNQAIVNKYGQASYMEVSTIPPAVGLPHLSDYPLYL